MIDLVKLRLLSGAGGNGRVAFRREKYIAKGGPNGGHGGDGGSVIIRMNPRFTTLQHLANLNEIVAKAGEAGGKQSKSGSKGESKIIEVPPGTTLWLLTENHLSRQRRHKYGLTGKFSRNDVHFDKFFLEKEGQQTPPPPHEDPLPEPEDIDLKDNLGSLKDIATEQLIEINAENPEIVICQGGFGGRGNESFKASNNTTPLEAEYGTIGEQKMVLLELRLLADVGFVGFPNAGKSTLLSTITQARPKIANYPFTTLEPQLGVLRIGSSDDAQELVIADIPGLIEGAHEGKGLGFTFLRHLEHCQTLVYVLFLDDAMVVSEEIDDQTKAQELWKQYQTLQTELKSYDDQLYNKKSLLIVNKRDLYSEELLETIKSEFVALGQKPLFISGYTGEGLESFKEELFKIAGK